MKPEAFRFHLANNQDDYFFSNFTERKEVENLTIICENDPPYIFTKKQEDEYAFEAIFKEFQFFSKHKWAVFDANIPAEFPSMGMLLKYLTFDKMLLVAKLSDNRAVLYIPFRVTAFQQYCSAGQDRFSIHERFSFANISTKKENPSPILKKALDYVKTLKAGLLVVVYTFPALGLMHQETLNLSSKPSQLMNHIHKNIVNLYNQMVDLDCRDFLSYICMIEEDIRTPLLAYYHDSLFSSSLTFTFTEETPIEYILGRTGSATMAKFFEYNILITQPFNHGPWYLWYSNFSKKLADETMNFLCAKFSKVKEFGSFLEAVYKTNSIIPYRMFNDVMMVNIENCIK